MTSAEREARRAFRQVDAVKAMTEHETAQKAFSNKQRTPEGGAAGAGGGGEGEGEINRAPLSDAGASGRHANRRRPIFNADQERAQCWGCQRPSGRSATRQMGCCLAFRTSDQALLRIFARRSACHQPMASGRRAKSQPDLLI